MSTEDFLKRDEDRKWRDKVDHVQVTLMTGHQVHDRRLDDVEDQAEEIDKTVRGDPATQRDGLEARYHALENNVAEIRAVLFKDAAGNKGVQGRLEALERGERRSERVWASVTQILVAMIMSGLIGRYWPEIASFMRFHHSANSSKSWIKPSARHGGRKKAQAVRQEPDETSSDDDVPEVRDDHGADSR